MGKLIEERHFLNVLLIFRPLNIIFNLLLIKGLITKAAPDQKSERNNEKGLVDHTENKEIAQGKIEDSNRSTLFGKTINDLNQKVA